MKDLHVIMGNSTSLLRGTMSLYLDQLKKAGIDHDVDPLDVVDSTISTKLTVIRKAAWKRSSYAFLVITDAFDMQFFGTREQVLEKIPLEGVLLTAERNCHPPECRSLNIPDAGPWRFANGGGLAGTPENILRWCDEIEAHPLYKPEKIDQMLMNELVAQGSSLAQIDSHTTLFFCLYGGYEELDFAAGMPINMKYATWPNFIHANGGWSTREFESLRRKRMQ